MATVCAIFFNQYRSVDSYSVNYVRALYGIGSGTDLSLKTCEKIASDLKSNGTYDLRISVEDEARLTKVKAQVDKLMGKVNEPPAKFMKSKEKLAKLYGIYSNLHSLTLAPKGSLQNFSDSANIA